MSHRASSDSREEFNGEVTNTHSQRSCGIWEISLQLSLEDAATGSKDANLALGIHMILEVRAEIWPINVTYKPLSCRCHIKP